MGLDSCSSTGFPGYAAGRNAGTVTDEGYLIFVFATCTASWCKWVAGEAGKIF